MLTAFLAGTTLSLGCAVVALTRESLRWKGLADHLSKTLGAERELSAQLSQQARRWESRACWLKKQAERYYDTLTHKQKAAANRWLKVAETAPTEGIN